MIKLFEEFIKKIDDDILKVSSKLRSIAYRILPDFYKSFDFDRDGNFSNSRPTIQVTIAADYFTVKSGQPPQVIRLYVDVDSPSLFGFNLKISTKKGDVEIPFKNIPSATVADVYKKFEDFCVTYKRLLKEFYEKNLLAFDNSVDYSKLLTTE